MKRFIILYIAISLSQAAAMAGSTKAQADSLYAVGDYKAAIQAYESILQTGYHADLFYNLGNAYYRDGQFGRAILNYERAYLLAPGNKDMRFNLTFAKSKVEGNVVQSSPFLQDMLHSAVYWLSAGQWDVLALVSFGLALVLFLFYFFHERLGIRKVAFVGMLVCLFLTVVGNACMEIQRYWYNHRTAGVVVQTGVARTSPSDKGASIRTLQEGTRVKVAGNASGGWLEVVLPDGKKGWMKKTTIELI